MQISNNTNAMLNIQNQLNENASNVSQVTAATKPINDGSNIKNSIPDITELMVEQIQIPIAYSANAGVISVQNAMHKSLLDIKA